MRQRELQQKKIAADRRKRRSAALKHQREEGGAGGDGSAAAPQRRKRVRMTPEEKDQRLTRTSRQVVAAQRRIAVGEANVKKKHKAKKVEAEKAVLMERAGEAGKRVKAAVDASTQLLRSHKKRRVRGEQRKKQRKVKQELSDKREAKRIAKAEIRERRERDRERDRRRREEAEKARQEAAEDGDVQMSDEEDERPQKRQKIDENKSRPVQVQKRNTEPKGKTDWSQLRDHVAFGEVAPAPPTITMLPKMDKSLFLGKVKKAPLPKSIRSDAAPKTPMACEEMVKRVVASYEKHRSRRQIDPENAKKATNLETRYLASEF